MTVLVQLSFGYDVESIQDLMDYLEESFVEKEDYVMLFARGEDVMNSLLVLSKDLAMDKLFMDLVEECDGGGTFTEE